MKSIESLIGDDYLKITGTGPGTHGGCCRGTLTVGPVPEPGEWALMLSGGHLASRFAAAVPVVPEMQRFSRSAGEDSSSPFSFFKRQV